MLPDFQPPDQVPVTHSWSCLQPRQGKNQICQHRADVHPEPYWMLSTRLVIKSPLLREGLNPLGSEQKEPGGASEAALPGHLWINSGRQAGGSQNVALQEPQAQPLHMSLWPAPGR